jgi:hypothetical protein
MQRGLTNRRASVASSMSRSSTPSASPRRGSSPPSVASATATTTHSPRRSTVSSRPRSSADAGHGAASRRSSSPRSNGSTATTTAGCSSPSATSRPQRPRNATTPNWSPAPWRRRTQTKQPPGNPARFKTALYAALHDIAEARHSTDSEKATCADGIENER